MSKINVSAGLMSSEAFLLSLQMGLADVCFLNKSSYGIFSVHVYLLYCFVGTNFLLFVNTSQTRLGLF